MHPTPQTTQPVLPPAGQGLPPLPGTPETAAQHPALSWVDQNAEGVVALKHRPSGNFMPFNPEMAESPDVVGVDKYGNEVFNTPFQGSMENPNAPKAPPIMGYVTSEEHAALLARLERAEQELVRLAQSVHDMQNPHLRG